MESFQTSYGLSNSGEEKLQFTPYAKWSVMAASTTSECRRVSSEARLENCMQVWGLAKFGQHLTHGWGKIVLHTCSDLSKPVQSYLNLSTIQWPCTLITQSFFCTFECSYSSVLRPILVKLHILTRLIESFPMVYGLWHCIAVKLSIPLGAHALRPWTERPLSAVIF